MKAQAKRRATPPARRGRAMRSVEVRGITKIYDGGVQALDNISVDFPRGELTSLLGPSGCGKTTLLKIIAGLLPATAGEVLVERQARHRARARSAPSCSRISR